jgi:hypothetical protein
VALSEYREALIGMPIRPRLEGSILIKEVNPLLRTQGLYETKDLQGGLDYGHQ